METGAVPAPSLIASASSKRSRAAVCRPARMWIAPRPSSARAAPSAGLPPMRSLMVLSAVSYTCAAKRLYSAAFFQRARIGGSAIELSPDPHG